MVTPQEKAQCVSWFIETKSNVQTQQRYRTKNEKDPPSRSSIRRWHKKFMETGSVLDAVRSGRPRTSAENIKHVRQAFSHSPIKSIRTAARHHSPGLLSIGLCEGYHVSNKGAGHN